MPRRRRNPESGFTTKDYLIMGGVAAGLYLLYQAYQTAKSVGSTAAAAVGAGYNSTVSSVGNVLSNWFGPALTGTNKYFTAIFPDGSSHAVPSNIVNSNGSFIWTGYPAGTQQPVTLTLAQDANGNWLALES